MNETNRYYYQRWIQMLLIIVCLCVFSGFIYLAFTAAWGISQARDIGIVIFLLAWFICFLVCLWGLNKVFGYVELHQSSITECYFLVYKINIDYTEIDNLNIINKQNSIDTTQLFKILPLFIASPGIVIAALLKPVTIEISFKNSQRKYYFLQKIDDFVEKVELDKSRINAKSQTFLLDIYKRKQNILKMTVYIAIIVGTTVIGVFVLSFIKEPEALLSNLIALIIFVGILVYGVIEFFVTFDQHYNYDLRIKKDILVFANLKSLSRFYEPKANIPYWFKLPINELRSFKVDGFPYRFRRLIVNRFTFNSKYWQIEICDLLENSHQFIERIKQLTPEKPSFKESGYYLNVNELTNHAEYKIDFNWVRWTGMFLFLWTAIFVFMTLIYINYFMPRLYLSNIIMMGVPLVFVILKSIKLYKSRKISAQLADNKLTFRVGGLKLFNFFIRDIGFTNQTIDLSDLVKVCYCTYPDSNISGLAERFTLKFKSSEDIQILNMFENGGDLFNRLVAICRLNHQIK